MTRRNDNKPSLAGNAVGTDLLRRLEPVSRKFGFDRGQCIDRYYIERFLDANREAVRGRVLEVAENTYTRRFGGERVTQGDVLHAEAGHRSATIVADLTKADHVPGDAFDCIILTQTLQHIYDVKGAIRTLHRILKPGGVLLCTVPGISQISRYDMDRWGDFWRLTTLSTRRLFEEVFPSANLRIESHGNVLVAVAFLHGLAVHEVDQAALNTDDSDYQVLITIRAEKPR
jgi:SAM-dependent methyltransferase